MNLPIEITIDPNIKFDAKLWEEEMKHRKAAGKGIDLGRSMFWATAVGLAFIILYFLDWIPVTGTWANIWLITGVILTLSIPLLFVLVKIYGYLFLLFFKMKQMWKRRNLKEKDHDPNEVIQKLILSAHQIEIKKVGYTITKPWEEVESIEEYPSFILINAKGMLSHIFSKAYFAPKQLDDMKSLLDQWPNVELVHCYPNESETV